MKTTFELNKIPSGYYTVMEYDGLSIELSFFNSASEAIAKTKEIADRVWGIEVEEECEEDEGVHGRDDYRLQTEQDCTP